MSENLKIKLVRSVIGCTERQRKTVNALGLRKINDTVEHKDTHQIRGMIKKVDHLVEVEVI